MNVFDLPFHIIVPVNSLKLAQCIFKFIHQFVGIAGKLHDLAYPAFLIIIHHHESVINSGNHTRALEGGEQESHYIGQMGFFQAERQFTDIVTVSAVKRQMDFLSAVILQHHLLTSVIQHLNPLADVRIIHFVNKLRHLNFRQTQTGINILCG
ncbi:hypothetical protein D1872_265190 [compost metagenome]